MGGGGGTTSTQGVIPPELQGLYRGSAGALVQQQKDNPLGQYNDPHALQVAGADPLQGYGASMIGGGGQPTGIDGLALQAIMREPGLAGAGPTTGQYDYGQEAGLQNIMSFLNPNYAGGDGLTHPQMSGANDIAYAGAQSHNQAPGDYSGLSDALQPPPGSSRGGGYPLPTGNEGSYGGGNDLQHPRVGSGGGGGGLQSIFGGAGSGAVGSGATGAGFLQKQGFGDDIAAMHKAAVLKATSDPNWKPRNETDFTHGGGGDWQTLAKNAGFTGKMNDGAGGPEIDIGGGKMLNTDHPAAFFNNLASMQGVNQHLAGYAAQAAVSKARQGQDASRLGLKPGASMADIARAKVSG